jgi:hypothetical protein
VVYKKGAGFRINFVGTQNNAEWDGWVKATLVAENSQSG